MIRKKSYVVADQMISSLGFGSEDNFAMLCEGNSGIRKSSDKQLSQTDVHLSLVDTEKLNSLFNDQSYQGSFTRYEKLHLLSISDAISQLTNPLNSDETLLIISSTKGNIDLLSLAGAQFDEKRVYLWNSAEIINKALGFKNDPVLISNACISGVVALSVAKDYIEKGLYKNVIVSGADIASEFVISGFQSFKAIGSTACKPFDKNRDGITLGEGASTIIVSDSPLEKDQSPIILAGTGISNDANHISGPSRTGDGLALSISKAMQEAGIEADSVDYISAHGTATPYNDEMESKALELAKVNHAPLNSCKAYFGHTLGAAGLLESSALIHSMRSNIIFPSIGCDEIGVSGDINLITEKTEKEMYTALKTASGFGGCNASAVFTKVLK